MRPPRIMLLGYYGKGNFGDDVLLTVAYRVLREAFPNSCFSVVVHGDAGSYVAPMLGEVDVLPPSRHGHFDLIVHGGGGVFFDFAQHGLSRRIIEYIWRTLGFATYIFTERLVRRALRKPRTSATRRLGIGIGVGGFSAGSARLLHSLPVLADFAALWVRDAQSVAQLKRFSSAMHAEVILGSDLAFLTQHWIVGNATPKPPSARPHLGIILRDWPESYGGFDLASLAETLATLAIDYEITGFVFDQHTDPKTQQLLAPYATHIWQPEHKTIQQFSELLSTQDVLLTSRAHGAICGACLGVPSVIVALEPKLEQVHAMLPNASRLAEVKTPERWPELLREACSIPHELVQRDVQQNRLLSEAALHKIREYFE